MQQLKHEIIHKDTPLIGFTNSSNPIIVNRVKKNKSQGLPSPVRDYFRVNSVEEFLNKQDKKDPLTLRARS